MAVQLRCSKLLVAPIVCGAALCAAPFLAMGVAAAATQTSSVTVTLATLEGGTYVTGPLFGGNEVLEYQITVSNQAPDATSDINLFDKIPPNATYEPGSATCNSTPNCTVKGSSTSPRGIPYTVSFDISSLAGNSSAVLDFSVTPRTGALYGKLTNTAHWTGAGCSKAKCNSNRVAVPVQPRDVLMHSSPQTKYPVIAGESINYLLSVHNYSKQIQNNVAVIDPIPAGTSYVAGSASCLQTPACTASESGGILTYTIASVIPKRNTNLYTLGFTAKVTSTSAPVSNVAAWTGDQCDLPHPCATNQITYTVIPSSSPVPPVPPRPPVTIVPPRIPPPTVPPTTQPAPPTTTTTVPSVPPQIQSPTASQGSAPNPPANVPNVPPGPKLVLSPSTISPGGSTVASGSGCPAGSLVVVSIDGRIVTSSNADQRGDFSISIKPGGEPVGQHTVTAACGSERLSGTLTIVVTAAGNSPASSAGFFGVFVLLGAILVRGQFVSDGRRARRRRGNAATNGATSESGPPPPPERPPTVIEGTVG